MSRKGFCVTKGEEAGGWQPRLCADLPPRRRSSLRKGPVDYSEPHARRKAMGPEWGPRRLCHLVGRMPWLPEQGLGWTRIQEGLPLLCPWWPVPGPESLPQPPSHPPTSVTLQ